MKRKVTWLLAVFAAIMISVIMAAASEPAYAAGNDSIGIQMGAGILENNVNTDNSAHVSIGSYFDSQSCRSWRVIGYDGKGAAAKKGVITFFPHYRLNGGVKFNDSGGNEYAGSTLKKTLDEDFSGSSIFTSVEKSAIRPRRLEGGSADYDQPGYDSDKVKGSSVDNAYLWPLSVKEAESVASGIRGGEYWLRTPGMTVENRPFAAFVFSDGSVIKNGRDITDQTFARGAIDIDLDRVLFTSDGSKRDAVPGDASLHPTESPYYLYWKLTLLDDARKNFTVTSVASNDGKTLRIKYRGALAGENEYISAMIVDSDGSAKYYGKLAEASGVDNTLVTVNTAGKWDPDNGDRLYVFNE